MRPTETERAGVAVTLYIRSQKLAIYNLCWEIVLRSSFVAVLRLSR